MRNTAIGYWQKIRASLIATVNGLCTWSCHAGANESGQRSRFDVLYLFLYYEELTGAPHKAADMNLYVHNSQVLHKESVSTGRLSALKIY